MPPTRQRYIEELDLLRTRLLEMGATTEELVRDSVVALVQQDAVLAASLSVRDDAVDQMEVEIETLCLRLMARQQPVATDLRLIGMALKVVTDIERIGDHAVDIGRVAQRMSREALYKPLVDIPRMGDLARGMLHDALTAFVYHDIVLVEAVIAADDQIDALYARMRLDLQNIMQHDATAVIQASHLLFVGHYLERICDHCTNIAERIVYLETGRRPAPARSVGIVTTARNGSSPAANPAEAGSLDPSIDRVPA